MRKAQLISVQELTLQRVMCIARTIDRIADHRVSYSLQMNTDLVGAAGFQLEEQEGAARKTLEDTKVGTGLPTLSSSDRHLLTMARIAANRSIDTALIERDIALYQSQIAFLDGMVFHLLDQRGLRAQVFRNDQQPGGIAIQTMDNTWSLISLQPVQCWVAS